MKVIFLNSFLLDRTEIFYKYKQDTAQIKQLKYSRCSRYKRWLNIALFFSWFLVIEPEIRIFKSRTRRVYLLVLDFAWPAWLSEHHSVSVLYVPPWQSPLVCCCSQLAGNLQTQNEAVNLFLQLQNEAVNLILQIQNEALNL